MNIRPRQQKPRISKVGRKWLCIGLNCGAAAHSPWAAYEEWDTLVKCNNGNVTAIKSTAQ